MIMRDFECPDGHRFESLEAADVREVPCRGQTSTTRGLRVHLECANVATVVMSAPLPAPIQRGNHDYAQRERERLTVRSNDHWKREGRHEAVEREKKFRKQNGLD